MKKIYFIFVAFVLLTSLVGFVTAHGEETFAQAEEIIEQKISCDELTEDQLEILGDYYMEQMHPGEQHEIMDEMMGGEGSESLKQMHINIGLSFYCGERDSMSRGMMDMMMGRNMMTGKNTMNTGFYNMMSGYNGYSVFGWLFMILVLVALVLLIVWLIKQIQEPARRRKRR